LVLSPRAVRLYPAGLGDCWASLLLASSPAMRRPHCRVRVPTVEGLPSASFGFISRLRLAVRLRLSSPPPLSTFQLTRPNTCRAHERGLPSPQHQVKPRRLLPPPYLRDCRPAPWLIRKRPKSGQLGCELGSSRSETAGNSGGGPATGRLFRHPLGSSRSETAATLGGGPAPCCPLEVPDRRIFSTVSGRCNPAGRHFLQDSF
jgi:hypothetical protein